MRTIRKIVASIAFVAVAAIIVMFALANRDGIAVSLWPLPFAVELRLSVAVLGALAAGIILGFAISWVSGAGRRHRRRSPAPAPAPANPATPSRDDPGARRPQPAALERLPAVADRR